MTPTAGNNLRMADQQTVLIVDDEEIIRAIARDILEMQGYQILEAGDGRQAVDLYRIHRDAIDLVILDMSMPVMGGKETFDLLAGVDNDVKVILSTGFADSDDIRQLQKRGVKAVIEKPFRVDELVSTIQHVLAPAL